MFQSPIGHIVQKIDANAIGIPNTYYDSRTVDGSLTEVRFFQQSPTQSILSQNYENQPFDGVEDYYAVGLGFSAQMPIIHDNTADAVKVQQLVNGMAQMIVEMRLQAGNRRLFAVPLVKFFSLNRCRPSVPSFHITDTAGAGATPDENAYVHFREAPMTNLWQPFEIAAQTPFYLKLHIPAAVGTLIAAMDFSNQPGTFGFTAALQYGKPSV